MATIQQFLIADHPWLSYQMFLSRLVLEGQVFDVKLINRFLAQLLDALQQFLRGLFQMQHTEIASSIEDRRYIILVLQISQIRPRRERRLLSQRLVG